MKKRYPAIGIAAFALGLLLPLPHFGAPSADAKPAAVTSAVECQTGNTECASPNTKPADTPANNYAEAYHLCAFWEKTDEAINECRWAAWYAFNPTYNPTAREA